MPPRTASAAARLPWARWGVALTEPGDGAPLCLSLANTRHFRNSAAPRETLAGYTDLVLWAHKRKILDEQEARRLGGRGGPTADVARRELAQAVALREAIARTFARHAHAKVPDADDLAVIVANFNEAARHLKLELLDGRLVPCLDRADAGPRMPRWQAALSAVALLSSESLARVKECADDRGCGWLFLDLTRNGSRMYCFSNECGNRARQQRFRERLRLETRD
jgi:predicted RNA-binding Zn ribbon-like protein